MFQRKSEMCESEWEKDGSEPIKRDELQCIYTLINCDLTT